MPALTLAFLDGRFDDALLLYEEVSALGEQLGVRLEPLSRFQAARRLIYTGDAALALQSLPSSNNRPILAHRAVCLAHLDRHDEALAIRERFGDVGSEEDESGLHVLTCLLEAAVLGRDRETAEALVRRLDGMATSALEIATLVCIARLLGGAADLLGDAAAARGYYEQALEVAGKIRFRPEIALTHLQLAELQLRGAVQAERGEALGHLDFAITEFREMKMQPSLERALRRKEVLKA
ncbi:MAG TPA: hypothetical protein VK821_20575 [Dehalococcoidia bacterium]|nr:hypothetical protein [Dehalococcoidia bacterium]